MTDESLSKDRYFELLGELVDGMIAAHGKDFTMGTLVLAARFIAEDKRLTRRPEPDPAQ